MEINEIEKIIKSIVPDNTKRNLYLNILCEAIKFVHSFGPEKWGLSIRNDGIRLHVGNLITTTVHGDSIWVSLDKELLENEKCSLENELLLSEWDIGEYGEYSAIKTRNYFFKEVTKDKWEIVKKYHFEVIEKAAKKYLQLRVDSQKNNSIELLNYLKKRFDSNLPTPEYKQIEITGDTKFNFTGYWILYCNPKFWAIDEFLETKEVYSSWKITDWQKKYFQKGQKAVIRVGNDTRTKTELACKTRLKPGIYAIVEVLSNGRYPISCRQC